MNPVIDPRTREDILDEIKALARERTPEWHFEPENPDAGAMLAFIWADMLSGTIERLNRICENYRHELYASLDAKPRQAAASQGFLSFDVSREVFIPKGFRAGGENDTVFSTTHDLYAAPLKITGVYTASPDTCCRCEGTQDIMLFNYNGINRVVWTIRHPFAFGVSDGGSVGITGVTALSDPAQIEWVLSDTYAEARILDRAAFDGIALSGIGLLPQNENLAPDVVYSNETQCPCEGFFPFGERYSVHDELYIACDEVFSMRGATVEMSLSFRMEKFPIEGFPEPSPNFKPVMVYRDLNIPDYTDIFITEIIWEYFNGSGWAALETTPHRNIFYSTDRREMTIGFTCPDDFDSITIGAHEKFYIRARITQTENTFAMFGHYHSPFIENLRFKSWFDCPLEPESVSSYQNMAENTSPFFVVERVFNEHAMYLSFDNMFTRGTVLVEFDDYEPYAAPRWEYYARRGWRELEVHDGTEGFSRTGLISYSTDEPCELHTLFGKQAYWIRIIDPEPNRRRKPVLKRLWNNAAFVECETAGELGNAAPDSINILLQDLAGVEAVTNPLDTVNGRDEETYEDAVKRVLKKKRVGICRKLD